jgi:hypothetical protein
LLAPELSLPPVPLCAQEADANAIIAATVAIIARHFAIFTSLEHAVLPPRICDSALQAQSRQYGLNSTLCRMSPINSS